MTARRQFLIQAACAVPATVTLLTTARLAQAQAAKLTEADPAAASLGYKEDATKADAKKFPTYAAGRVCSGCQLYQGKPTDATGPCLAFGGKLVSSKGWCAAWAKKA
jgi:hypothetical protein